ncbi:MAG: hypothetical protein ACYCYA_09520 [Actinomycetes bacterium]
MTGRRPAPPRVSRAEMARQLARVRAERQQPRELPPNLARLLDDYHSRHVSDEQMPLVRQFLRTVLAASSLTAEDSIRDYRTHLAALAGYALRRGKTPTPDAVLTTGFIDEYIRRGMAGAGDPLKARRRGLLLALARAVNPGPTVPAKLTPIPHSGVKPPYTPAELAVIVRVCRTQPTETQRRDLATVVALGAGAGPDSVDLRGLRVEHFEDLGSNGLQVHVHPPSTPPTAHRPGPLRAGGSAAFGADGSPRRRAPARCHAGPAQHGGPRCRERRLVQRAAHRAGPAARDVARRPHD